MASPTARVLRILFVNHTSVVSGGERSLLDLVGHLPDHVQPLVACPPGELGDALRSAGVATVGLRGTDVSLRLHPVHTPRAAADLASAALAVRRLARRHGVHLVHANSLRAGLGAVLASRLGGPPTVVHLHDSAAPGRTYALALAWVDTGAALLLANSQHTSDSLSSRGLRAPVHVVHNPVDVERFRPGDQGEARSALGLPDDRPLLAVIAQITPWKGQDDALRALALVRRRGHRPLMLIVGAAKFAAKATRYDNLAFERRLHTLVDELGLRDDVRFLGERDDVPRILTALDALLVPSWEEPFGLVVAEALACGCPVIATAEGGPTEILRDGRGGLLVPPREPQRWADAMEALLADRTRARATAAAGRRSVVERFAVDRYVARVVQAYETALGGAG